MKQNIKSTANYFELFSLGLALGSIFVSSIIYLSYALGCLSILFALLSRGAQMKFSPRAKKAILISVGAMVLSTILFVGSLLFLLQEYGSLEGILRAGSEMLGIDFEQEFGILFQ